MSRNLCHSDFGHLTSAVHNSSRLLLSDIGVSTGSILERDELYWSWRQLRNPEEIRDIALPVLKWRYVFYFKPLVLIVLCLSCETRECLKRNDRSLPFAYSTKTHKKGHTTPDWNGRTHCTHGLLTSLRYHLNLLCLTLQAESMKAPLPLLKVRWGFSVSPSARSTRSSKTTTNGKREAEGRIISQLTVKVLQDCGVYIDASSSLQPISKRDG